MNQADISATSEQITSALQRSQNAALDCDVLVVDSCGAPDSCGALLVQVRTTSPLVEVVLLVSDPPVFEAVEAFRGGLFTVLQAPSVDDGLVAVVRAAADRKRRGDTRLQSLDDGLKRGKSELDPRPTEVGDRAGREA